VDPTITHQSDSGEGSISSTLLRRVKENEPEAWSRLTQLYGPQIYRLCRQRGLQAADAADIVQETFRAVARKVGEFKREKPEDSFQSWLVTIAVNKIRDHFRGGQHRPNAVGGTDMKDQMAQLPDQDPSAFDTSFDDDARVGLKHRAMEILHSEFEESTWQSFWRMAVWGQTAAEIAQDLGMSKRAVRQAKYRVLRRLKEELT